MCDPIHTLTLGTMKYGSYSSLNCCEYTRQVYLIHFLFSICECMQLQDYALGQMESKTNLGYVKRGCGTSATNTHFLVIGKEGTFSLAFTIIANCGIFFQIVFVWIASAVLLKVTFKEYLQKTFTYSYDVYGMFWGTSTTAVVFLGIVYGITIDFSFGYFSKNLNLKGPVWNCLYIYTVLVVFIAIPVMELPVAIYIARKATVAVPGILKYPATLLCCGRKRRVECFVTMLTLWVDLVALQLVLLQAAIIVFTISAAPFAIITNVMLVVLALFCLANIFSLLFTISAHLCTPADQRGHSSSMVLRAVVVLPLLFMIMCYGVVVTSMGSVTNMDAKKNNIFSFINSAATPILLGMVGIFLKRFISTWLKWSPRETGQETTITLRQETDKELLVP